MRLLILTQYFPPETGAPQNRLFELAVRLINKGIDIEILTAMPNYPRMKIMKGYEERFYLKENLSGLTVHRSYIFVSKNKSIFFRLLNYFSFVFSSLLTGTFKLRKLDYILCESPPLFLGISALILAKLKGAELIFNVSDLWPESAEKLGLIKNKFILRITTHLEELLYRKSVLITGQTQGIVKNISSRFPQKMVYWLKNGADIEYFNPDTPVENWRNLHGFKDKDFLLFYAGIIGYAQGLEVILYAAERLTENKEIKFIIMGSGPEKKKLLRIKQEKNLENVYFFDNVSKDRIPHIIKNIDTAIIPLKRIELFKGAIPSKIFEILALAKPILLGVEGEAEDLFIKDAKAGYKFEPENHADLADKIMLLYNNAEERINLGKNGRKYVVENFDRNIIAAQFLKLLNELSETDFHGN